MKLNYSCLFVLAIWGLNVAATSGYTKSITIENRSSNEVVFIPLTYDGLKTQNYGYLFNIIAIMPPKGFEVIMKLPSSPVDYLVGTLCIGNKASYDAEMAKITNVNTLVTNMLNGTAGFFCWNHQLRDGHGLMVSDDKPVYFMRYRYQ